MSKTINFRMSYSSSACQILCKSINIQSSYGPLQNLQMLSFTFLRAIITFLQLFFFAKRSNGIVYIPSNTKKCVCWPTQRNRWVNLIYYGTMLKKTLNFTLLRAIIKFLQHLFFVKQVKCYS